MTPTQLSPLERDDLNPVILNIVHHCKNPLQSTNLLVYKRKFSVNFTPMKGRKLCCAKQHSCSGASYIQTFVCLITNINGTVSTQQPGLCSIGSSINDSKSIVDQSEVLPRCLLERTEETYEKLQSGYPVSAQDSKTASLERFYLQKTCSDVQNLYENPTVGSVKLLQSTLFNFILCAKRILVRALNLLMSEVMLLLRMFRDII